MIYCTTCGGRTRIGNSETVGEAPIADALNVFTRTRYCTDCNRSVHTTEITSAELGELRRQSYLWRRHGDGRGGVAAGQEGALA